MVDICSCMRVRVVVLKAKEDEEKKDKRLDSFSLCCYDIVELFSLSLFLCVGASPLLIHFLEEVMYTKLKRIPTYIWSLL